MANKGFNGTTVSFPSTASSIGLRGVSLSETAAEVNIGGSQDAVQTHTAGIKKQDVTVDLVGGSTITAGSTGTMTVTWYDGTTISLGRVYIISKDIKGQMDGEITTSLKVTNATTA